MKFKSLFTILPVSLLMACYDPVKPDTSFNVNLFEINFPVGQSRVIYRSTSSKGKINNKNSSTIGIFKILKDTAFNGNQSKILSSVSFEYTKDTSYSYYGRQLLVQENNHINLYDFKDSNTGMLFGLLKSTAYDTSIFSDKMTVLEYPITINKKWKIRDSLESYGNWVIDKELVKIDTVQFNGQNYQCGKFVLHSIVDLTAWVSNIGLLKAQIDYGTSEIQDSNGVVIDSVHSFESYELLMLNPKDSDIDSIKSKYSKLAK